jgi:alanine racemase
MNSNYSTWIALNQTNFEHNAHQFKRVLGNAQLGIVVKANAYGHGMQQIAQMGQECKNVSWFCVAMLSEALQLRSYGIKKPILSLGHINAPLDQALGQHIDFSLYDYELAQNLQALGAAHNYTFNVHIKIDTGLSRLGIDPQDALDFIKKINSYSHVKINGLYSHFAESQKLDQSYTLEQTARFKAIVDAVNDLKITIPFIHLANSASVPTISLPFCNLSRVGAGIYGLWSSPDMKERTQLTYPEFNLKPIMCWKARIMHIQKVKAHSFIGYDRTYQAPHDMNVASLPIGYYDGYDFRLFNKSNMILHNTYTPVVGRIAMNITLLDVTHIPQAKKGDEVIIMGNYPQLHPYELGMLAGNPNVREITTKINPTIKRFISNKHDLQESDKILYTNAHTMVSP